MKKIVFISALFLFLSLCSNSNTLTNKINRETGDKDLIDFIDHYSDSMITLAKLPGMIISITRDDKIIYEKAKGLANIETNEAMDSKMLFRIGSLTKTFTATVLLQLVDEGKLKLDDPIDKFFPQIPNAKSITVRMLGDMSSGLYSYSEDLSFDTLLVTKSKMKWTPQQLIDVSLKNPPYFEPGKSWHYSNTNTILLGMIIEKLTGNTLDMEIKKRITDKLGLKETWFATEPEFPGYRPAGYDEDDATFAEPLFNTTEKYDPSWAWAAGAMVSSVADLKIYLKALSEGTLTSKESHTERLKWSLERPEAKYGFGIFQMGDFLGHNGSYPGFRNISMHSAKTNTTVIIFYNAQTNRSPDALFMAILPMLE